MVVLGMRDKGHLLPEHVALRYPWPQVGFVNWVAVHLKPRELLNKLARAQPWWELVHV